MSRLPHVVPANFGLASFISHTFTLQRVKFFSGHLNFTETFGVSYSKLFVSYFEVSYYLTVSVIEHFWGQPQSYHIWGVTLVILQ
jgi:hypothetical protein